MVGMENALRRESRFWEMYQIDIEGDTLGV